MSEIGYLVRNVSSSNFVADLSGGNNANNTPVLNFTLNNVNSNPAGSNNQRVSAWILFFRRRELMFFLTQWRIDPVPAGVNLYTIQNVFAATYAGVSGIAAAVSSNIFVTLFFWPWFSRFV
jgi:hypothetical protein